MKTSEMKWVQAITIISLSIILVAASFMATDLDGLTVTGSETYADSNELRVINTTVEPTGDTDT